MVLSAGGIGQIPVLARAGFEGLCWKEASLVTRHAESRRPRNWDQLQGGMG